MADDPVDLAIVDGSDVAKALLRDLLKNYVELRVASPSIIQNTDFSGRAGGIYIVSLGTHFQVDLADTTTADNGTTCLVDTAGNRWKSIDGRGVTTIDFGAFPGSGSATKAITGLPGITANARVRATIAVADSADHTADEHWLSPPRIYAGSVVAGTGFTIYGASENLPSPGTDRNPNLLTGLWNVAWEFTNAP